jgi:hypothetical protein
MIESKSNLFVLLLSFSWKATVRVETSDVLLAHFQCNYQAQALDGAGVTGSLYSRIRPKTTQTIIVAVPTRKDL